MSFMYPLGLLGLIGIPIVIIIYILRSKYNEQTVTSTYIWELSEKFLKRRNPLSGLTGLISLILQILTIAAISLAIARPVFVLPGAASDYRFILDSSSSMNMQDDGESRFDRAKEEIIDIIDGAKGGSSYSLVTVASDTVTVFEGVTDKDVARELVEEVEAEHTTSSYADTLGAAQDAFDNNPSSLIYLVTDKSYETHENIELVSVGDDGVDNYSLTNVRYSHFGGKLSVAADVISYASDAELDVRLVIDGEESAVTKAAVKAGELTEVTFDVPCLRFESFRAELSEIDAYIIDDGVTTYNIKSDKSYSILIVSDTGFFLEAVVDALIDSDVVTVTPEEYERGTDRYGLYIFDSYSPSTLPEGAVWLINSDKSIADSGFGVRGKIDLGSPDTIEKSKSTATNVRKLLESVDGSGINIKNYVKYSGMYLNFYTLFSYDSNPLIFAGANALGNRQVVFGFDLHESDFALSTDFVMLMRNLLEYSFPDVIDETVYTVGDDAIVNVLPNAEHLKAISPSGEEIFIDSDGAAATLTLDEIGTYVVSMTIAGAESRYNIYSGAHPDESNPEVSEAAFSLSGEREYNGIDGEFDATTVLLICLAVLFIADWGVYCYEKYQLR